MKLSQASWWLAACMGTLINASGILEVDLVFPRNESYAPIDSFPVVFAFQNAELARYLNPRLTYDLWSWDNSNNTFPSWEELRWVNWTDYDTYFAHSYFSKFNKEGRWRVRWTLSWDSCDQDILESGHSLRDGIIHNSTTWSTDFTIKNSAPKVDLIAATSNKTCPGEYGVAINVTDKTMKIPFGVSWSGGKYTNDTCAVLAFSPTPTPNPCRVHINKTTVESMEASLHARLCNGLNPPDDCPEEGKNAAQQLAVTGIFLFLSTVGAIGFLFKL